MSVSVGISFWNLAAQATNPAIVLPLSKVYGGKLGSFIFFLINLKISDSKP
jgi:hypothetical protein